MDKKELGIGMMGAGWMARAHTNAYSTIKYMYYNEANYVPRLIAIAGADAAESAYAADRYGYERAASGLEDLLNDPKVIIFDNVTPEAFHVEPTIAAAKAGKHVYCEKPIATNAADAKRMRDAADAAGVKHVCGFSYRFFPAVRLAYELIKDGKIGDIYHYSAKYYQEQGRDPAAPLEKVWYANSDGISQGITTHAIDMSRFLVSEVAEVQGNVRIYNKLRRNKDGKDVEVTSDEGFHLLLNYENGASGIIESLGVAGGKGSQFSWEIFGTKGSIGWNVQDPNQLYVFLADTVDSRVRGYTKVTATEPNHPFMNIWWPQGHTLGWEHGHINLIAHFCDCVANDKPVAPLAGTFNDGYRVAKIVDTVRESSLDEGRRHSLKFE